MSAIVEANGLLDSIEDLKKKNQTVLVKAGVRLENDDGMKVWVCLASATCRQEKKVYSILKGTSTAAQHLKEKHGLVSNKAQVTEANKRQRDEATEHITNSDLYSSNKTRYGKSLLPVHDDQFEAEVYLAELVVARLIVNHNLPLRFVEYEGFRLFARTLVMEELCQSISNKKIKHVIFEMWAHVIQRIKMRINAVRRDLEGLPSISINCDGYTNAISGKKFIGVRAYYVVEETDARFKFESKLLAMKPFAPTFAMRQSGLVNIQVEYFAEILKLYGIDQYDLFGATSDAGPDIKKLMRDRLKLNWEWCWSHEFACAMKV